MSLIPLTGLKDIHLVVTVPGCCGQMSFHCWLLTVQTSDRSKQLFSFINIDPNEVYYFCTDVTTQNGASQWLNNLPEYLSANFSFEEMGLITRDQHPTHSYKETPAGNTILEALDKLQEATNQSKESFFTSNLDELVKKLR
eukprot:9514191-Ditylum_brightwellii.AAC.1